MATVNRLPDQDQAHTFLTRFNKNVSSCARILGVPEADEDSIRAVVKSLESLERQVGRVAGHILSKEEALSLLEPLKEMTAEARTMIGKARDTSNYSAPRSNNGTAITEGQLQLLASSDCTAVEMAQVLNVSERTVWRRLQDHGISLQKRFATVSDAELDKVVEEAINLNQNIGAKAIKARLLDAGLKVQRQRVRDSVVRVDPVGVALRSLKPKIERNVYVVAAPNSWWHLDGNHKLIRYGIVIHGSIDGYSRLITFLKAANNNKASTVLENFLTAIHTYGTPSRIRVDQGVENADICLIMNLLRGFDRSSAVRGTSVHNQRIERAWVDTWNGATHMFYKLFAYYESRGFLDIGDVLDVWLLQMVYLPVINRELERFRGQWNHHGLSTERGKSPKKLFLFGMLKHCNSELLAVRDFFDREGMPAPKEEVEAVTSDMVKAALGNARVDVPPVYPPLSDEQQLAVSRHVEAISTDKDYGMEKYMAARQYARQLLA